MDMLTRFLGRLGAIRSIASLLILEEFMKQDVRFSSLIPSENALRYLVPYLELLIFMCYGWPEYLTMPIFSGNRLKS